MNRILQDLSIMLRANLWLVPVLAALVAALFYFVAPPPPMHATLSSGSAGGGYAQFAEKLRAELAKEGFELKLVNSSGSRENTERLLDKNSRIQLALVQSGQGRELSHQQRQQLYNLGAVYQEPLWLFVRAGIEVNTLKDLIPLRTAVGAASGGVTAGALPAIGCVTGRHAAVQRSRQSVRPSWRRSRPSGRGNWPGHGDDALGWREKAKARQRCRASCWARLPGWLHRMIEGCNSRPMI